jgi:hypothetical protein
MNKAFSGDKLDANHMPAKASYKDLKIPANGGKVLLAADGPAIQMEKADHEKTASYGSIAGSSQYRDRQKIAILENKFGKAIQMDITNVESIAAKAKDPERYTQAIKEMIASLDPRMKAGARFDAKYL